MNEAVHSHRFSLVICIFVNETARFHWLGKSQICAESSKILKFFKMNERNVYISDDCKKKFINHWINLGLIYISNVFEMKFWKEKKTKSIRNSHAK